MNNLQPHDEEKIKALAIGIPDVAYHTLLGLGWEEMEALGQVCSIFLYDKVMKTSNNFASFVIGPILIGNVTVELYHRTDTQCHLYLNDIEVYPEWNLFSDQPYNSISLENYIKRAIRDNFREET